jgi:serine/threonine-protein phosphatase 6 regulatory ankyrin repeat subunit A
MCQLTFAMFDRERVVEEIPDEKAIVTSGSVSGDAVGVEDPSVQKNRKAAKDALRQSKKDIDEHFLFRQIHYHREVLVSKASSTPESLTKETHRKFGIEELPPLHRAAAKASLKEIADLLENGIDVNEKIPFSMRNEEDLEFHGASPLHIAAWFGKTKSIDFFLDHGANVNSLDSSNTGILIYAMRGPCRGRIVMPLLSTYGADPNIRDRWGNLPLHIAAEQGISLLIHPLVEAGNDLNEQNSSGSTALIEASNGSHEQAVQALLDLGADTTICSKEYQWNPLHVASFIGSKAVVDMLLQETPESMTPDVFGNTTLHIAALKNHFEVVRLLLESGADVTVKNNREETPLHYASIWGGFETAKLLIENGADVLALNVDKESALDKAAFEGHEGIALLLLDHGADVNSLDELLWSPLHGASLNGHDTTVRLLLQHGANPCLANKRGRRELHIAMEFGHESIANYLFSLDPTLTNVSDLMGYNYLHYAAIYGSSLLSKLLLDGGFDIEALPTPPADHICGTALVLACRNGETVAAKTLLDHGANIHAFCTPEQDSSLHMAMMCDHQSTVKLLLEQGANIECRNANGETPLISGSRHGSKSIKNLLDAGADINAYDKEGFTALHYACGNGHESVVEQLLASGAQNRKANNDKLPLHVAIGEPIVQLLLQLFPDSVNVRDQDGWTALHSAAIKGNLPLMDLLLKKGSDVEAQTNLGSLPLHYAAFSGREDIVEMLIQQKPHTINARENNGVTVLHSAVSKGHLSIAKLLLVNEPNLLEAKDDRGRTALFLAFINGWDEVVEFLLQQGSQLILRDIDGGAPWDYLGSKVPTAEMVDLLVRNGWNVDE